MARYHSYRVYKLAIEIIKDVQQDIRSLKNEFDIIDQMKRSSRSIVANICEGSERRTNKELKHFLVIARASVAELQSWYEMSNALGFIDTQRTEIITDKIDHVGRSLSNFIKRLESS